MQHQMSGGIVVNVRDNSRLESLRAPCEKLRKKERELGTREGQIDAEIRANDNNDGSHPRADNWEQKRRQLKAEGGHIYAERQTVAAQLKTAEEKYQEWLNEFAAWQHKATQLQRELDDTPNAPEENGTIFVSDINAPLRRQRWEVQNDLVAALKWLATFAPDVWQREYEQLLKQIDEERGVIRLQHDYVQMPSGEFWTEQRLQQVAAEKGNNFSCRGVRSGPYRKGSEVKIEEAQRLGLI